MIQKSPEVLLKLHSVNSFFRTVEDFMYWHTKVTTTCDYLEVLEYQDVRAAALHLKITFSTVIVQQRGSFFIFFLGCFAAALHKSTLLFDNCLPLDCELFCFGIIFHFCCKIF